jgi:hypothetical protein
MINQKIKHVWKSGINNEIIESITKRTYIPLKIIFSAMTSYESNPYHNFGHALGTAETAITIAYLQGLSKLEATLVGLGGLFHDALRQGIANVDDELRAALKMLSKLSDADLALCNLQPLHRFVLRDLVVATIITLHGKVDNPLAKIIQDADISYMGKGPYMYLYACMGLVDEFSRQFGTPTDPISFIRDKQKPFIDHIISLSPNKDTFFLSPGARELLQDPREVLEVILSWENRIFMLAYDLYKIDIDFDHFTKIIDHQRLL